MSDTGLLVSFFLFVMGSVVTLCGLFLWRTEHAATPEPALGLIGRPRAGLREQVTGTLRLIGEILPNPFVSVEESQRSLIAAGYRQPSAITVFFGLKSFCALMFALVLGWVGLLGRGEPAAAFIMAMCGLGFGYLLPDLILRGAIARRVENLERALPPALDLLVLSIEAGQNLDAALLETGRELRSLFPDLAGELAQVQLELRAGRSRTEVLEALGSRTSCEELKKLATVLIDTERFGTSLAPALRTHAKYLRTRRRHQAQEAARKLGVKLIFPVFFLVMPSVFVVTLGPALIQMYQNLIPMVSGAGMP